MTATGAGPDVRAQLIARGLGRRLAPLVVLLATVVSIGTPSAFLAFGLLALRTEARLTARSVAAVIERESVQDPLWKYNATKLLAHLKLLRELPKVRRVEIADARGRRVPAAGDHPGPTVLDDLGLEEALGRLCDDFAERTGLDVERRIAPLGRVLAPALERTCFRIVQEALTNVARHASASRVQIGLRREGERLELEISDDGRGLSPEVEANSGGTGLAGIRERVLLLGGSVELASPPEGGTCLRVLLPCAGGPAESDPPEGKPEHA